MAFKREQRSPETEERRRYNRDYMRRWRANPHNLKRERINRQHWHYLRKLRDAAMGGYGEPPLCAFCHQRPPVCRVQRLEVVQGRPGGFVEVSVPYCGHC